MGMRQLHQMSQTPANDAVCTKHVAAFRFSDTQGGGNALSHAGLFGDDEGMCVQFVLSFRRMPVRMIQTGIQCTLVGYKLLPTQESDSVSSSSSSNS